MMLGDATTNQLAFLQAQLSDLANALRLAKVQSASADPVVSADGQAAFTALRARFLALSAQAATLRAQASASDAPSTTMRALDQFSDSVLSVAHEVGIVLPGVVKSLPLMLGVAVLVLGLLYLPKRKRP